MICLNRLKAILGVRACKTLGLAALTLLSGFRVIAREESSRKPAFATSDTSPTIDKPPGDIPYRIQDGRVFIPGWDDRKVTETVTRRRLGLQDFENSDLIRGNRLIVESGHALTKPFRMDENATELVVGARGWPEEHVFPRLRITIQSPGAPKEAVPIFVGYLQSFSIMKLHLPIPAQFRGREVQVKIEFLNPSSLNDHRVLYIAFIDVF